MSKSQESMHKTTNKFASRRSLKKTFIQLREKLLRYSIIMLILASGCGSDQTTRILSRSMPGEPRTLDPHIADDSFSFLILRDLYEGLTAEDRQGRVVPGVASSWDIDKSGTTYAFHLRPNAQWSDGQRIVAGEFVQGLRHAVDPNTGSGSAAVLSVIRGASEIIAGHKPASTLAVTAIDDQSLRIELEHPAPYIVQILSQPVAAPLHLPQASPQDSLKTKNPVSDGPYTLTKRVNGSYIELTRNPHYWDASNVPIERVRYLNAESEATELREYSSGQLDMTSTIPMPDLDRITKSIPKEVQTAPIVGTLFLDLNMTKLPLRDSKIVRQALAMATDRVSIARYIMMGVAPAYSLVAPGASGYVSASYGWAKWSRERQIQYAQELLARAGYSPQHPLHLKLYFNSNESIQRIMLAVADSWKKNLAVETELLPEEFRVFLAGRKDRHHWDAIRIGWYADFDDASSFLEIFTTHNNQNDAGYSNIIFDKLIDAARVEPDSATRLSMLEHAENILLDDYPLVPIYFYQTRRLVKPYVGGAAITPMNHTYSKHLFWKTP